jgi:hypothetical protein
LSPPATAAAVRHRPALLRLRGRAQPRLPCRQRWRCGRARGAAAGRGGCAGPPLQAPRRSARGARHATPASRQGRARCRGAACWRPCSRRASARSQRRRLRREWRATRPRRAASARSPSATCWPPRGSPAASLPPTRTLPSRPSRPSSDQGGVRASRSGPGAHVLLHNATRMRLPAGVSWGVGRGATITAAVAVAFLLEKAFLATGTICL